MELKNEPVEFETSGRKNLETIAICDAAQRSVESGERIRF
jgi:ASC-1-like (ASCH) protein